jgi:hypothetical protein
MAITLLAFDNFPKERELIGQMLMSYGELEFSLLACIGAALGDDEIDTAARILYRVRGEAARLDVSDAIVRPAFNKLGLLGKWGNALGAARICKNIRNQYAHCHWNDRDNKLYFMNFDADARSPPEIAAAINEKFVDAGLLQQQLEYFGYALSWFYYLECEYLKRVGKTPSHDFSEPKSIAEPPLYNPQN